VVGTQINLDGNDLPVSQATVDRVSEAVESEWEVADAVDLQQRLVLTRWKTILLTSTLAAQGYYTTLYNTRIKLHIKPVA
jgi:hypothetical protein